MANAARSKRHSGSQHGRSPSARWRSPYERSLLRLEWLERRELLTATADVLPALVISVVGGAIDSAQAGPVAYTIEVTNRYSQMTQTGATITDTLPTGLTNIETPNVDNGTVSVNGNTVTDTLSPLPFPGQAELTITATPGASVIGTTITNTATVYDAGGEPLFSASATVTVPYAWTGMGNDNLWSNPANWQSDAVPQAGANLIMFPQVATQYNTDDDLGVDVSSINVLSNYTISGQPLPVENNVDVGNSDTLTVAGTLTLGGALNGGNFVVAGQSGSPAILTVNGTQYGAVTIDADGTLNGVGSVVGAVTAQNGGVVAPGPAGGFGALRAQSADFSSGGVLAVAVSDGASGIESDSLNVSGTATFGGTSVLEANLTGLSAPGTASAILQDAATTGEFSQIELLNNPNAFTGTADYEPASAPTSVNLTLSTTPPLSMSTATGGSVVLGSGSSLTDSATLSGGNDPTGTIEFALYLPSDTTYSSPVYTTFVPIHGDGVYSVNSAGSSNPGGSLPTTVGMYQWLVNYGGDLKNPPLNSGQGSEPELVSPATLRITSMAGGTVLLGSGQPLSDTATVSGGFNPTGTVTFYLFPPGTSPNTSGTGAVYTDVAPLSDGDTASTGSGTTTGNAVPAVTGTYQWVAIYDGDANNLPAAPANLNDPNDAEAVTLAAVVATAAGTLSTTEGATLTGTVATFTDPNGAAPLSSYSATINWGDGTSATAGTISGPDSNGVFTVTGSHVYADETDTGDTVAVTIQRTSAASATVTDSVTVADAPLYGSGVTNAGGPDVYGNYALTDHDLIGIVGSASGFTDTSGNPLNDNLVGTAAQPINPLLGFAGSYGGTTETEVPLPGSPALDAGDPAPPAPFVTVSTDQRGLPRVVDGMTDIGATQHQAEAISHQIDIVTDPGDGTGATLRNVIAAATAGDTVEFASNVSEIDLTQGPIEINKSLSIVGPGASALRITQTTTGGANIFGIDPTDPIGNGVGVSISGLTLTGGDVPNTGYLGGAIANGGALSLDAMALSGNSSDQGGAIWNYGVFNASNTQFTNNIAGDYGGAIENSRAATLVDCTFSNNAAAFMGGAISNQATLSVTASTFTKNSSNGEATYDGYGGAVGSEGGDVTIVNSTFSGNTASDAGAIGVYGPEGPYPAAVLTIANNTISGNTGVDGVGGVSVGAGNVIASIANTIVAGSSAPSDPDVSGAFAATDHDLVGVLGDATGFTTTGPTASIVLGTDNASAIGLGPLADNGGPTQTMALLRGSPAIQAGDTAPPSPSFPAPPATDQRGLPRIVDGTIDIGAYELQDTITPTAVPVAAIEGVQFSGAVATFSDPLPRLTPDSFAATINWGDGQSSAGTVTGSAAAGFTVSGDHTYADEGAYMVLVIISDPSVSTTVPSSATVTVPLTIVSLGTIATNPRNVSMASDDVTFSEAINLANFNYSALSLTLNGGANLINSGVTVSLVGGTTATYLIAGLAPLTTAEGIYVLSVDASKLQDPNGFYGIGNASVSWMMDTTPPTGSSVAPLAAEQSSLTFSVTVNPGTDPVSGGVASGIASYDIYVASAPAGPFPLGPFTLWTTVPANDPTATFTAQSDTVYAFHSIARDAAGNTEIKGADVVEASTYVPDLTPPVTQINSDAASSAGSFTLAFSGTSPGGSGVKSFVLAVQVDNGPLQQIGTFPGGTPVGGVYSGQASCQGLTDGQSHTYVFWIQGINGNGVAETMHSAPPVTETFAVPVVPQVTSFVVEKGLSERSYIRYLDVTFNEPVGGLTLDTAHVQLVHYGLDGVTFVNDVSLTNRISLVDHVMEIDFGAGGIGGNENLPALLGNLSALEADDGYYALTIDPDGTGLHDVTEHFYRLFGDVIGNATGGATKTGGASGGNLIGQVSSADVAAISAAVGEVATAQTPLLNADINGAGSVTLNDRLLASKAVGRKLVAGLAIDD
jgi:hypothetical protein